MKSLQKKQKDEELVQEFDKEEKKVKVGEYKVYKHIVEVYLTRKRRIFVVEGKIQFNVDLKNIKVENPGGKETRQYFKEGKDFVEFYRKAILIKYNDGKEKEKTLIFNYSGKKLLELKKSDVKIENYGIEVYEKDLYQVYDYNGQPLL